VLGGLARRVSFVEKLKGEGKPVLVVDSGHLFTDAGTGIDHTQSLTKARLISRAYKRMGVAAINVGDWDLMQGMAFLREEASRGLPLISANLVDQSRGAPIFKPYIIKKINKTRIAFFGLLSPDINPTILKATGGLRNFTIERMSSYCSPTLAQTGNGRLSRQSPGFILSWEDTKAGISIHLYGKGRRPFLNPTKTVCMQANCNLVSLIPHHRSVMKDGKTR
jgi:hypothetical protein